MIGVRLPNPLGDKFQPRRINRAPSPILARGVPWLLVALASITPHWLVIASAPILPPFGFLMLLAWRQLHPGVLPMWAGLPLGFVDDLFSGQPFGSAILLWSLTMILFDFIETRFPWRNFLAEWLVASALLVVYAMLGLIAVSLAGASAPVAVLVPQITVGILVYPLVARLVAAFDRFRLLPFMVVR